MQLPGWAAGSPRRPVRHASVVAPHAAHEHIQGHQHADEAQHDLDVLRRRGAAPRPVTAAVVDLLEHVGRGDVREAHDVPTVFARRCRFDDAAVVAAQRAHHLTEDVVNLLDRDATPHVHVEERDDRSGSGHFCLP